MVKNCRVALRSPSLKCASAFPSPAHSVQLSQTQDLPGNFFFASEAVNLLKQPHLSPRLITLSLTPGPPLTTSLPGAASGAAVALVAYRVLTFAALPCHSLIKCYLMAPWGPKQATHRDRICLAGEGDAPSPLHLHLLSINTCGGLRET